MKPSARPPEQIELAAVGAVVRRYRRDDLDALHAAIELSRDHLRPWMPWADQSRATTEEHIVRSIAGWDEDREFGYIIVDVVDDSVLGGTGLHNRLGPDALEIGYWRRADVAGRGIITASSAALTAAAFGLPGIMRVEIHCDAANTASAAIPRRLGYTLDRIEDDAVTAPGEHGRSMIWTCRPGQLLTPRHDER